MKKVGYVKYIMIIIIINILILGLAGCSNIYKILIDDNSNERVLIKKDGKTITVIDAKKNNTKVKIAKKVNGLYELNSVLSDYSRDPVFSKDEMKKSIIELKKNIAFENKLYVNASSTLSSTGGLSYEAKNLLDGDINNAWVEGNKNDGVGEYLEFVIENKNVISTDMYNYISIFNGYRKNNLLWNSNSRVKKFKMYINDIAYSIINLKDTPIQQIIYLPESIMVLPNKLATIKLEIESVYKGDAYLDTSITAVNFGFNNSVND